MGCTPGAGRVALSDRSPPPMLSATPTGARTPVAPLSPVSQKIWERKYRLRAPTGAPIERSIEDTWDRVATALAAPEAEPAQWAGRFRDALTDFKFMPAGRILAGRPADGWAHPLQLRAIKGIGLTTLAKLLPCLYW